MLYKCQSLFNLIRIAVNQCHYLLSWWLMGSLTGKEESSSIMLESGVAWAGGSALKGTGSLAFRGLLRKMYENVCTHYDKTFWIGASAKCIDVLWLGCDDQVTL